MVVDSSVRPAHMVDLPTLLASAPLMLMPTTAMEDMEAMAAMVVTVMERGPLMPMPTMAMEDIAAMEATAATAATATERGLPMLMPTTAMVVMAMADMAMASKSYLVNGLTSLLLTFHDTHRN